jgi:glycosyltransferase involved in cell wall biosynthesis
VPSSSVHQNRAAGLSLGVDARGLYSTGIGRYLREVIQELFADARFRRVTLLGDPDELRRFVEEQGAGAVAEIRSYPGSWYSRRTQASWLAGWLRGEMRADVWFFPFGDVPLVACPKRSVVTVHDLTPFKLPESSAAKLLIAKHVLLRAAIRKARWVIADSESTRRDVVERFPSAAGKVQVVHLGVNPGFRSLPCDERGDGARFTQLRPFLLGVGNRHPHKNWRAAVDALALLRPERRDLRLVMAGGRRGPEWDATIRHAQAVGVGDALVDVGEVTDAELRFLYGLCEAFVFPSLYEGFGLPVLEAMACGAPVVASDRSSLPEVVGDAGLLVDPCDVSAMAEAIRRLEREPGLRAEMVRRGIERAARFSWKDTARRMADILYRTATS